MKTKERIEEFNRENKPFYIVDHEGGRFSLCLPLDMLPEEYYPYCQEAFDAYAVETGVSPQLLSGRHRFGDGYDWQAAFCQAFAGDPSMEKISFDCEASGFFCGCDDLDMLEQYGAKFREICTDTARFTPIVSQGIRSMEQRMKEQDRLMKTVRGQLMGKPKAVFHIMTPDGTVTLHPADTKELLDGTRTTIDIDGVHYAAFELLDQKVAASQTDLFNDNCIRMKTEEPILDMAEQTM